MVGVEDDTLLLVVRRDAPDDTPVLAVPTLLALLVFFTPTLLPTALPPFPFALTATGS